MKLITSDLHFYHKNIIKYCPKRLEKIQEYAKEHNIELTEENTVDTMNKWLIDMWNSQVWRHDDNGHVNVLIHILFVSKSSLDNDIVQM